MKERHEGYRSAREANERVVNRSGFFMGEELTQRVGEENYRGMKGSISSGIGAVGIACGLVFSSIGSNFDSRELFYAGLTTAGVSLGVFAYGIGQSYLSRRNLNSLRR